MNNFEPKQFPNQTGHIIFYKDNVTDHLSESYRMGKRNGFVPTALFSNIRRGFAVPFMADDKLEKLTQKESRFIDSIEPDLEVQAFAQEVPWGVGRIGATASTSSATINNTGPDATVHIFVLDTGVSPHPDLNVVEAKSFVPAETSVLDLNGHGTGVAGVAAARDNTVGVVGIAPGAPIHSYKCLDKAGSGSYSAIIAALDSVVGWKLKNPTQLAVVNMSLGGYTGTFTYTVLDSTVQKVINQYNIPVVVAAGNSGDLAALYSPAHTVEAITVGAYNAVNTVTSWSNYGSVVDIQAPGANILTTSYDARRKKYGFVTYNGTSFSCPHVAGAVALYLSRFPTATPADILTQLKTIGHAALTAGTNPAITSLFPNTTNLSVFVAAV